MGVIILIIIFIISMILRFIGLLIKAALDAHDRTKENNRKQEYKESTKSSAHEDEHDRDDWRRRDTANPYKVLGIGENASVEEVREAFQNMRKPRRKYGDHIIYIIRVFNNGYNICNI